MLFSFFMFPTTSFQIMAFKPKKCKILIWLCVKVSYIIAIADIDMSSCGKVPLCLGSTLLKSGTNWLSLVKNVTVLLQQVNLSHSFRDI